jgi:recombinational DNA repair protein RecR
MDYELCAPCRKVPNELMCKPCQEEVASRKSAFTLMTIEANEGAFELEDVIYADSEEAL